MTTKTKISLLQTLCNANIGIIQQKLQLMNVMKNQLGHEKAKVLYCHRCPIVGASIGQHIRHSMDHIELIANQAASATASASSVATASTSASISFHDNDNNNSTSNGSPTAATMTTTTTTTTTTKIVPSNEIHYDIRQRDGLDEHDIDMAYERAKRVEQLFIEISNKQEKNNTTNNNDQNHQNHYSSSNDNDDDDNTKTDDNLYACFMLSGNNENNEYHLPTTLQREMGFVTHHAIHHLAMIKIIIQETIDKGNDNKKDDNNSTNANGSSTSNSTDTPTSILQSLSSDFGKAPSTQIYENTNAPKNETSTS